MSGGVNVDPMNPNGKPDPAALVKSGFTWVRLVSRPGCEDYVRQCQAAGLMVMACVAKESAGWIMDGIADVYQIGNEPDVTSPSSWTMTPTQYREEWRIYRETYPDLVMISAGLASGLTNWWQQVRDLGGLAGCSGMAVHPYGKTATAAMGLILNYRALTPSTPVWVTEWNRPKQEVSEFAAMLERLSGVAGHAWFAWSDAMDAGFGLTPQTTRMLAA